MADARRAPLKDLTDISGARALIVEARFYDDIQDAMLEGAIAELKQAGVSHDVLTVTGSLEIPATIAIALDAAEKNGKPYDAAIALGCVIRGDTIHFEIVSMESSRALKIGDELGGHIVAGHADGIATIDKREDLPDMARFTFRTTRELARFIATKGSITLDGVSLTVNTVDDVAFSVLIIPHTLNVTTLNGWREGSEVNIEVDLMARYAARLSEMK